MHSVADVLESAETHSNCNFLDSDSDNDDKVGTNFIRLREMQRFMRISNYLLDDELCNDNFIDRFDSYELSWP
jgi:hypothetical protein